VSDSEPLSLDQELTAAEAEKRGQDPRFAELERLAAELYDEGKDFRIEHGRILRSAQDRQRDSETSVDLGKDHMRFGLVSDTHGGSKFEQLSALQAFYRHGDEAEVDAFIHAGDFVQGSDKMHLGMEHEVHAHGSDAQVSYVVGTYPKSERGVKTYAISGNHDASFLKDGGSNVVRQISKGRDDVVYLGQDAAYLTIGNLRVYVVHPDGGGSYAKSYKGQKFSESLPQDKDVRLLLLGHYHNYVSFMQRETAVFQLPCFQSQYSWLARKGLHPDIGGILLDLWLDDNGGIRRMSHEVVRFPALEDDWDHEVSDSVNRGWSSSGLNVGRGNSV
jgi:predicted phosphodiesterase